MNEDDLRRALDELTPREQQILLMRFGVLGTPRHTGAEIAQRFEVCRQRVAQILRRALGKLEPDVAAFLRKSQPLTVRARLLKLATEDQLRQKLIRENVPADVAEKAQSLCLDYATPRPKVRK